jgi:hypothetical protein
VWKVIRFQGILTLTHNATSLILPSAANITTAANDRALMYSLGSGNWVCAFYETASGRPITGTVLDSVFRINDDGDTTKQIAFQASGITTGTTRTLTVPDADLTIVGLATTQTLTNKTLTSPTITTPTINTSIAGTAIASQSDMETGTSTSLIVTPGRVHHNRGANKVTCRTDYSGSADANSFNLSSVTDNGTGDLTINFSVTLNAGSTSAVATVEHSTQLFAHVSVASTTSVRVLTKFTNTAALADGDALNVHVTGDI